MQRTYTVTTTKLGQDNGLDFYEEVSVDVQAGSIHVDPSGALMFTIGSNGEVVIYSPGSWNMVAGGAAM